MSSKRSSKVFITQGSPRTSNSSLSSRSSSGRSSASGSYTSSNYGYNYESSATSTMGRSGYSNGTSSMPREEFLRVPDPRSSKDGISKISRGNVDVINHEKRHVEQQEPRSSEAQRSEYNKPKPEPSRKHKK